MALLVTAGLAAAGPAYAAAGEADLSVDPVSSQLAKGVKEAKAKPFTFNVTNKGPGAATGVTVTVDVSGLTATRVGWVQPAGCTATETGGYTCPLSDIAAGTGHTFGVPLFSTGAKGAAGVLKVSVSSATADPDPVGNSVERDITVASPGYDLVPWSQDLYADLVVDGDDADETDLTPVRPGDTAALDWTIYNGGSRKAVGVFYGLALPAGASFAELPASCVRGDIGGQAVAYCEESGVTLKPGQYFTDAVRITVGADREGPVLTPGVLFAAGLATAAPDAAGAGGQREGRTPSAAQRKALGEADDADNTVNFDIFVGGDPVIPPPTTPPPTDGPSTGPSASPTASTGSGGGGGGTGGGALPLTGTQTGLIAGIGLAVVVAGGLLFLIGRRRRVVLVAPEDEKPGA